MLTYIINRLSGIWNDRNNPKRNFIKHNNGTYQSVYITVIMYHENSLNENKVIETPDAADKFLVHLDIVNALDRVYTNMEHYDVKQISVSYVDKH